jgi:hypothetical protein
MTERPARPDWHRRPEVFILLLAFLIRLWKASGTFLNLDEAMHFLAANKPSLAEAYHAGLNLAHPPLLILFLYEWRKLGVSELSLRLPAVIAGTIFCWIFFKWLTRLLGTKVGWVGFLLASFLPVFVELSAEVRQYPLLLCFMMAAAFMLELSLCERSPGKMLAFYIFLYLAMVTHFSALLFAGAVGVYALWRLVGDRPSRQLILSWVAGQAGAFGLFVYLYVHQIARLKDSASAQHMRELLANSYFHRGHDHLLSFLFARTFGVLQYTFGQLAVGDVAGLLFIAAVVLLFVGRTKITPDSPSTPVQGTQPSPQQVGLFVMLPFAINAVAAIVDLYPYGGTRHSAFLIPFAIAGVSLAIVILTRQRIVPALVVAALMVVVCQALGTPHRPYMKREDQRRANMTQSINAVKERVAPDDTIFVDFQSSFFLRFYLCPEISFTGLPPSDFREFSCGNRQVISTSSETNVLTADVFLQRWSEMVSTYKLRPGQAVWIYQAGWDIGLAQQLQKKVPEFRTLEPDSFGRNISLFKLIVGDRDLAPVLQARQTLK